MQQALDRYANYLKAEKNASEYTVRNYMHDLLGGQRPDSQKGFFQFLRQKKMTSLEDVDRQTIRDYIAWLMEQDVVKSSIARKLSAIRSFCRFLVREEILPHNPLEKASSPKQERRLPSFLSTTEVSSLLETPDPATPVGLRDRALLELLYASGIRVSELVSLNFGQVDLDSNEIRVIGKGSKERVVLMGKPAARALTAYLKEGRPQLLGEKRSNAIFISRQGERLIERRVQKILEKYAQIAGIERRVHPHMLRHTFATHMLNGGADLRVVQELLGHADLSSTQVYTHVSKSQARKVYLSAHPLAQPKKDDSESE
ncbi:MAG: tyrosine recombinase XerC [Dehalococcoidales bacterium]|nr:MAG: tyrosine recombinase XerC [Dehalococcoidales bacterium]